LLDGLHGDRVSGIRGLGGIVGIVGIGRIRSIGGFAQRRVG
jgi:hypothetical protein